VDQQVILMSKLHSLRMTTSLGDIARVLGMTPSGLSYILFRQPPTEKYTSFQIPKRSGGTREILAPTAKLKLLQRKLSTLLQDCVEEIDSMAEHEDTLAHGFRRKKSIITNARSHRNRRFVFNLDLADFFSSINFGRVRGFFIHDKNFALDPAVATVIAQIACHDNVLPQGAPCSPVISNLIGKVLDTHLVRLASANACTYSRYADDLTFSTNSKTFPLGIAHHVGNGTETWLPGTQLERLILLSGFTINSGKTSMQYRNSRQVVTGLVVNKKVNIPIDYRRTVRAMVHSYLMTGHYEKYASNRKVVNPAMERQPGTPGQLHGMLGFIDSVDEFNRRLDPSKPRRSGPSSNELMYRRFLIYKDLYAADRPVLICEGETDNFYLSWALRKLASRFPQLVELAPDGKPRRKIRLYRYRHTSTARVLGLNDGGSAVLNKFISTYRGETHRFAGPGQLHPVIILFDNDSGSGAIKNTIANITKLPVHSTDSFWHITKNLYAVTTPVLGNDKESCIEDFFDEATKSVVLGGKSFSTNDNFDTNTHYGKKMFANYVVEPKRDMIDFRGFEPLLRRFVEVIAAHRLRLTNSSVASQPS
jgi:RNA-directed DNA polymerase